jgi:hypothetical protein
MNSSQKPKKRKDVVPFMVGNYFTHYLYNVVGGTRSEGGGVAGAWATMSFKRIICAMG